MITRFYYKSQLNPPPRQPLFLRIYLWPPDDTITYNFFSRFSAQSCRPFSTVRSSHNRTSIGILIAEHLRRVHVMTVHHITVVVHRVRLIHRVSVGINRVSVGIHRVPVGIHRVRWLTIMRLHHVTLRVSRVEPVHWTRRWVAMVLHLAHLNLRSLLLFSAISFLLLRLRLTVLLLSLFLAVAAVLFFSFLLLLFFGRNHLHGPLELLLQIGYQILNVHCPRYRYQFLVFGNRHACNSC
uniref:Uncharacterized protein n=1 Tax=Rhizophora mucronata TaxID=61149 RepID=A0A2P2KGR5_RHIMU